jgi:hypothetical protein
MGKIGHRLTRPQLLNGGWCFQYQLSIERDIKDTTIQTLCSALANQFSYISFIFSPFISVV